MKMIGRPRLHRPMIWQMFKLATAVTADLFRNGNQSFVRLASNPGSSGNTLKIKIPRGVLLPLKGEAATIEIFGQEHQ